MLDDGLRIPTRPVEDELPLVPADLTALKDPALMELMVQLVAWIEYIGVRLVRGEIEERELDLQVNSRASQLIAASWNGKSSDRVRIARAEADSDVALDKLRQKHLQAQAYRKIMQTMYEAQERKVSIVSRELTRRTSIEPYKNRTNKWGGA